MMSGVIRFQFLILVAGLFLGSSQSKAYTVVCEGATLVQQSSQKWELYIGAPGAGQYAQGLISRAASVEAARAVQDDSRKWFKPEFFWIYPGSSSSSPFVFKLHSSFGAAISNSSEFFNGRSLMSDFVEGNPFLIYVRAIDKGERLKFVLETARPTILFSGGEAVSCKKAKLRGDPGCSVQEFVFNSCRLTP